MNFLRAPPVRRDPSSTLGDCRKGKMTDFHCRGMKTIHLLVGTLKRQVCGFAETTARF